jgi:phosphatidylglycerol:prolipoprotein diacylglycerol transferase
MLIHPNIDPVALHLGPLQIHWYGIMYLIGFTLAWFLANYRIKHLNLNWNHDQVADLIFYAALGTILGGRIGYMVFYGLYEWIQNPLQVFKIWEGGMSFHGGLIGVVIALYLFAKRYHKPFLEVADFTAPLVPLGLAAGRLGNFINGELWGKPTDAKWGMIFPQVDNLPRHPSQLYEFGLEGIVLFLILFFYAQKPRPQGCTMALFLIFYGIFRFTIEFYRQPDVQLGYIFNGLTMGQLLSLPMFLLGLGIYLYQKKHENLS